MQALWLQNQQLTYKNDIPPPDPLFGEAQVRVRLAGICATDLGLVKGYYPYNGILGHEFVGDIVFAPNAPDKVGERVVGDINVSCGTCHFCKTGLTNHCKRRTVLGILNRPGAFAEYLCLPLKNLHPVPATVSDDLAVFTEPLAAALQIQEQRPIHPTDRVLIVGAGRLGQLIAQTLILTGCQLQVVARYQKQRELLATRQIPWVYEQAISEKIFDLVIEATGTSSGFAMARQAVRPQGTIILKSTYKGETTVNLSSLVTEEINVIGSRCGPFAPALRLLERGLIDPTLLIEEKFPLEKGLQAFERAGQPGALKVLLQMT